MGMNTEGIEVHPVQTGNGRRHPSEVAVVPAVVTLRAYEVYCALHGAQPAMVTGSCRGGFGDGEIVAYLYARGFPKSEWQARFDEALRGMTL
jgi:hypothetical protein